MSRKTLGILALLFAMIVIFIASNGSYQAHANSDVLDWPLDTINPISNAGYAVKNAALLDTYNCVGDRGNLYHAGVDFHAYAGMPVKSIYEGTVEYVHTNSYPGKVVVVKHILNGSTFYSMYGHLDVNVFVQPSQQVSKGQTIGTVRTDGRNTHLHFEIRTFLNPDETCAGVPGPGYSVNHPDLPNPSGTQGYTDPVYFINAVNGNIDNLELFEHSLFRGSSAQFNTPLYANVNSLNDMASSIAVPGGSSVTVWKDASQSGQSTSFNTTDINLDNNTYPDSSAVNDTISSLLASQLPCVANGTCNPNPSPQQCLWTNHDVVLWEHGNYYGRCKGYSGTDLSQTRNMGPSEFDFGVSSIYVNPTWLESHNLYTYDALNLGGNFMIIESSLPDLALYGNGVWNDQIRSLHNTYTGWLTNFSIADSPPLGTTIDVSVEDNGVHGALRVCFNGENCQETGALSLSYYWPTYLEAEGAYAITVERRDVNESWNDADVLEFAYYVTVDPKYTACGSQDAVLTLTSGVDCLGIREGAEIQDLGPWSDRSDLVANVVNGSNEAAWLSNGVLDQWSNFTDSPRIVMPGQTVNVGSDISSLKMLATVNIIGPVPDSPHFVDANTIGLWHLDGDLTDETGNYNGTLAGSAGFSSTDFGQGLDGVNPPDGSGAVFPAFDINGAFTIEANIIRTANCNNYSRLLGQLGANGNTGDNQWLIDITNGTLRYTQWHPTGSLTLSSAVGIPNDGSSNYLVITYDGYTSIMMYLNNVLVGSLNTGQPIAGGATTFEMGMAEDIYSTECVIDEVRISDIVREPSVGYEEEPSPTPTPTATSTPLIGVELLPYPVTIAGDDGSAGHDVSLSYDVLNGYDMVEVTFDLNGLYALGGDASALAFDQSGQWQYIALADYAQNGYDGVQTVNIPLADFMNLDPEQGIGDMHLRFWYWDVFSVDVMSIRAYSSSGGSTPTPTLTASPTNTPTPTSTPTPSGTELLPFSVNLSGYDGSDGFDVDLSSNALNGYDMVEVTLDLNGLYALGGDASALAFDQSGQWQYVGLSNYVQNGYDGVQTVNIPLSDFMNLDPEQGIGDMHLRFWYWDSFSVDVISVRVYSSQ